VEEKLAEMGYTYDNGMVNIWMSDEKNVRDIDEELFINNTEYVEDMSDDSWKPLEEEL
jgi:hypothetical protein